MSRDPISDPRVGDIIETYNNLLEYQIIRKVIKVSGCKITFSIDKNLYSCCIDIWRVINKNGKIVSQV